MKFQLIILKDLFNLISIICSAWFKLDSILILTWLGYKFFFQIYVIRETVFLFLGFEPKDIIELSAGFN